MNSFSKKIKTGRVTFAALAAVFITSASSAPAQAPWPLGVLTTNSDVDPAPLPAGAGWTTTSFQVAMPGIARPGRGFYAIKPGNVGVQPKGMVVCFSGLEGFNWFIGNTGSLLYGMAQELRAEGYTIAQIKWRNTPDPLIPGDQPYSWQYAQPGVETGLAHLACQTATAMNHLYQNHYLTIPGVPPKVIGQAGFCLAGTSGGASQIGYALSHYGLDRIVDVAVMCGGPIHTALAKSCMNIPAEQPYWLAGSGLQLADKSWGYYSNNGPAVQHLASYIPSWNLESIATGGNDFHHPTTRVEYLIGALDPTIAQATHVDHYNRLIQNVPPSPYVTAQTGIEGMEHQVGQTTQGVAALKAAIIKPSPPPAVRPALEASRLLDGSVLLNLRDGELFRTYTLDSSADLVTWTPMTNKTWTDPQEAMSFADSPAPGVGWKFYRLTIP